MTMNPKQREPRETYRKVPLDAYGLLVPCRFCGSPSQLMQRWRRDDVWDTFVACTNTEDVDGNPCLFYLPDNPDFYCDRKIDAVNHWNLLMGPRPRDNRITETK